MSDLQIKITTPANTSGIDATASRYRVLSFR